MDLQIILVLFASFVVFLCDAETTIYPIECPENMIPAKCNVCAKQCGESIKPFWECDQTCQEEPYCQCPPKGYSLLNGECIPEFFCPPVTTAKPPCRPRRYHN